MKVLVLPGTVLVNVDPVPGFPTCGKRTNVDVVGAPVLVNVLVPVLVAVLVAL